MNEEMFKNLSDMLGNSKSSDNITNIISKFTSNNTNNDENANSSPNFDFSNIDMATVMKLKNIMEKMNSKKNDPKSNLLLSLKPYLKPSRKEKLDQYIQFMNITSVIETFNKAGGENIK